MRKVTKVVYGYVGYAFLLTTLMHGGIAHILYHAANPTLVNMGASHMNIEKLLTRAQKEEVIRYLIRSYEPKAQHFTLRYDRRFGWDFEVRRHGLRPIVTFSVSVTDQRLGFVAQECARAIREIQDSTHAMVETQGSSFPVAIMGQRRVVEA